MKSASILRFGSACILLFIVVFIPFPAFSQSWTAKLDKNVRFYQPTDLGVLLVGTEKSLYALDSSTGEELWRRKDVSLDETDIAPVPGTDLLLISFEKGDKARIEATDLVSGNSIWRSDKLKGAVMQMAVDPQANLLAVVLAKDAKSRARDGFKRRPLVHVLDLASGNELWDYEVSEVEMMPSRWLEDSDKEVEYTLDNYYPPAFVDGRLYVFYEGVTSFDARSGKARLREKYRVNEDGLALTEAEPIFDDRFIYVSGHGRVRAISRESGDTAWEAKDLGLTPEMVLIGDVLYVRTGGQFTRLKDGDTIERGSYGLSAIDSRSGKVLWRYKGADKGITNLLVPGPNVLAVADRDDLIFVDAQTGKRAARVSHKIERASFGLSNERGDVVIGGQSEIARVVSGLSWSGLTARSSISNLQTLATASRRSNNRGSQLKRFGILDRVDPSRQLDRLSRFLWHRERLAALRGQWMYFYTDLKTRDGNGLAGVNINNGRTEREVRLSDLDERFIADEALGLMFTASDNRIVSHGLK